ncbi:MAG TPA: endopeptidase La, partial [Alphaproteobacteria bacterium]|nr:endopeptidase La [Alphaproteobacteria bacterium]
MQSSSSSQTNIFPVLPLRDIVVFPHMVVPLFVGRAKSINALEHVMQADKQIMLVAQREAADDDPGSEDIYEVGTMATVTQLLKLPDQTVKVLVEGNRRARILRYVDNPDFFEAEVDWIEEAPGDGVEIAALTRSVAAEFEEYAKLNRKLPQEATNLVEQVDEPDKLGDLIASHLAIELSEKQRILEMPTLSSRLEHILGIMEGEINALQVERKIRGRVKRQMEKTQREFYLNEQMKAIQRELGESEDGKDDIAELEEKIAKTKLSKEAREKADSELRKLRNMSPNSAEATVVRNYLDWLLSIPWNKRKRVKIDMAKAEEILDTDHYGLEKVKERILEYLAVQKRTNKLKGPILCLVGPPGVGKTSLGKSIARATGREFIRMSLGGVRDEAEIRGHRRTYIGSMPGKVIQSMKKA